MGFEDEAAENLIDQPIAPIDEQNVRAFFDEKNDKIYHVCLISASEISPETLRDQWFFAEKMWTCLSKDDFVVD